MDELHQRVRAARADARNSLERVRLIVEALALFHTHRRELGFIGASEMRSLAPPEPARIARSRSALQQMLDDEIAAAGRSGRICTPVPEPRGGQLPPCAPGYCSGIAKPVVRHPRRSPRSTGAWRSICWAANLPVPPSDSPEPGYVVRSGDDTFGPRMKCRASDAVQLPRAGPWPTELAAISAGRRDIAGASGGGPAASEPARRPEQRVHPGPSDRRNSHEVAPARANYRRGELRIPARAAFPGGAAARRGPVGPRRRFCRRDHDGRRGGLDRARCVGRRITMALAAAALPGIPVDPDGLERDRRPGRARVLRSDTARRVIERTRRYGFRRRTVPAAGDHASRVAVAGGDPGGGVPAISRTVFSRLCWSPASPGCLSRSARSGHLVWAFRSGTSRC